MDFETIKTFFRISDIKKIKMILQSQNSSLYVVKILYLSYYCSLLGSFPAKQFSLCHTCVRRRQQMWVKRPLNIPSYIILTQNKN